MDKVSTYTNYSAFCQTSCDMCRYDGNLSPAMALGLSTENHITGVHIQYDNVKWLDDIIAVQTSHKIEPEFNNKQATTD